jgi:multisubunit Na+/H+ antiporter MnhE subunit
MKALTLNLVIATIWLLLSSTRTTADFFIGLGLGFAGLAAFSAVLDTGDYPRRAWALVRFALGFLREFVVANFSVARRVLFGSNATLHPDFLTYDVNGLTRGEILVLSYCITLTPGTTTVQISEDFRTLTLHALDASDPDAVRRDIDHTLKYPLLRLTR